MATVSKSIADQLVAMDGKWDDDPQVLAIIEYDNAFGGVGYGVLYPSDPPNRYAASEFVRNPRLYWSWKGPEHA